MSKSKTKKRASKINQRADNRTNFRFIQLKTNLFRIQQLNNNNNGA